MNILKPVLVLAVLSAAMLYTEALATEAPPRVGATRPAPEPDKAKPAKDSVKTTPRAGTVKRRAVHQIIDGMPPSASPPPTVYRPQPNPAPLPMPGATSHILHGCPGGVCVDGQGGSYQGGVGTALISPQGKLCSNNGMTVQCF